MTIIYISHKLDEVERVTDEIVVMRDGRFVAREATANRPAADGQPDGRARALGPVPAQGHRAGRGDAPLLKVQGLSVPGWART